ncbi:MAG: hypothetical protein AAFQ04_04245 [Pseudomonadota bacterium]
MSQIHTHLYGLAPPLQVEQWFTTVEPLSLEGMRGLVIVIEAFQMLCPGCVSHGLPQAKKVGLTFRSPDVRVIGLHSVFEHHNAQTPVSLAAFCTSIVSALLWHWTSWVKRVVCRRL